MNKPLKNGPGLIFGILRYAQISSSIEWFSKKSPNFDKYADSA